MIKLARLFNPLNHFSDDGWHYKFTANSKSSDLFFCAHALSIQTVKCKEHNVSTEKNSIETLLSRMDLNSGILEQVKQSKGNPELAAEFLLN